MTLTLALVGILVAVVNIGHEAPDTRYCPAGAIGYVRVIKDEVIVAAGSAKYDRNAAVLTAWFPPKRSAAQVVMTLCVKTFDVRVYGRGSILVRGAKPLRTRWSCYETETRKREKGHR